MAGDKTVAACTFCGQPIAGDSPERTSPGQTNPCEYCDSLSGGYTHSVLLTESATGSAVSYVEGATIPQILLSIARFLLGKNDDKLCGIVTIVVHQACDVATERALADSFARKGIPNLEEHLADVLSGCDLANDKVRKIYTSMTGDEIQEQHFWSDFIRSAKRRDQIIRRGLIAGRSDAEESFRAARDLLEHLSG